MGSFQDFGFSSAFDMIFNLLPYFSIETNFSLFKERVGAVLTDNLSIDIIPENISRLFLHVFCMVTLFPIRGDFRVGFLKTTTRPSLFLIIIFPTYLLFKQGKIELECSLSINASLLKLPFQNDLLLLYLRIMNDLFLH